MKERFEAHPQRKRLNVLPEKPLEKLPEGAVELGRFPSWLHRKMPVGKTLWQTQDILKTQRLATVCEEAKCPNLLECYSQKTATFLVMGDHCTRACGFCDIKFSAHPEPLAEDEPQRVAESVRVLGLKHVVITMVARDDLEDQGAAHLMKIIQAVRAENQDVTLEILTSDFLGNRETLDRVLDIAPEIFNHNIETVRSLSPQVRHKATYERSLSMLSHASKHPKGSKVKSGIMVGLGESSEEVQACLEDLKNAGCHIVTIGQYLQPNRNKLRVKAFIPPAQFEAYATYGKSIGIEQMYAGPFVRSSYHAADLIAPSKTATEN